jgi:hypothetical protein
MAAMPILVRAFIALLSAIALSGCAGLAGTFTVDTFLNKEITGDTVGACMARSYQAWARNKAWVQIDYVEAAELAKKAEAASTATPEFGPFCAVWSDTPPLVSRYVGYWDIAKKHPSKACPCGNAIVELARWSCAGRNDDRAALKSRLEASAAACEGP